MRRPAGRDAAEPVNPRPSGDYNPGLLLAAPIIKLGLQITSLSREHAIGP